MKNKIISIICILSIMSAFVPAMAYAQETEYFDQIQTIRDSYTEEQRFQDRKSQEKLLRLAKRESDCVGDDRKKRK